MSPDEEPTQAPEQNGAPAVLVVEDEILIRMAAAEHLRACGFRVVEAANGEEARALTLAGVAFDLVFSDITMQGELDGIGLALWLKQQGVLAPVVLTSGMPSAIDAARSACAHVSAFIVKPYDHDSLAPQFRTLLNKRVART